MKIKKILKALYNFIPCKAYLFLFIRQIISLPPSIYKHLHFKGNFKIKIDDNHSFKMIHYGYLIENEIFWKGLYGNWEKQSLQLWSELCKSSETIFDIGANTGIYSLIAKTINSAAKVYAFEPVERVFKKLYINNQINNYNISCHEIAISNSDGKAIIYDKNTAHTYSVTVNKDTSQDPENSIPTKIDTIKLDTFISQHNITKIDLLKIDVETHEIEVFDGFKEHIKLFEPTILVEILNEEVSRGVEKIISGINYLFFNIDEENGITQVDHLSKRDYYNFLICKPEVAKNLMTLRNQF